MRLFIRADASVSIGSGHVMRCLTLAGELKDRGAEVRFISRALPGDLTGYVESKGFPVHRLEQAPERDAEESAAILRAFAGDPPNRIVVDHYGIDAAWESQLRQYTDRIAVIDDLADRSHDCDALLDQNLHRAMEERYRLLVPRECRLFLGPAHALLRPEFIRARSGLRTRDGSIGRVLVFFGGSDPTRETAKALEALRSWGRPDIAADVVVGGSNPLREAIERDCLEIPGARYLCQVENMAELMAEADLAIGAGGSTSWERCYLGLPAATVVVADNQRSLTEALADTGAVRNLGWHREVTSDRIAAFLEYAYSHPAELKDMGQRALKLMGSPRAVWPAAEPGQRTSPFIEAIMGSGSDA